MGIFLGYNQDEIIEENFLSRIRKMKTKTETASGISVDNMSEIDVLLEELVGKEESLNKVGDGSQES